jgi:hypothetical protein
VTGLGFNAGWIDFADRGAHTRHGFVGVDQAIVSVKTYRLILKALVYGACADLDVA